MTIQKKIAEKADSILRTLVWWCKPVIQKCIRNPVIILRMDGGTCSQLVDYVCLKMLEDAGYPMRMDITWYERYGEGADSVLARPYNIDKLFDLKPYKTAGKRLSWLYQVLFSYFPDRKTMRPGFGVDLADFQMPKAPCYLQGYYKYEMSTIEKNWQKYCTIKRAEEILDEKNLAVCREIESCENPIGVHVRRGDMAVEGGYWEVIPAQYFINLCEDLNGEDTTFFFFSEEPEWILKNIIPYVNIRYKIVSNNAFDGCKDLYLLSRCRYQATSQGSFGKYAYMMNDREDKNRIVYDKTDSRLWKWSPEL